MRIKKKENRQSEQKLRNTVDQRDEPGGEARLEEEEEAASLLSYSKSFGFRLKRASFLTSTIQNRALLIQGQNKREKRSR